MYHPSPAARNKLTTSDFFDEFARIFSGDNISLESVLVVSDFNFQMEKPNNQDTW